VAVTFISWERPKGAIGPFPTSDKEQQHHNRQQDIADVEMDVAVLQPSKLIKGGQHRGYDHALHMPFRDVMDVAMVMGPGRKPPFDGRVVFFQRGQRAKKF